MSKPTLERHGDSFLLMWEDEGVGFGLERLRDSSDGLKAELTVEGVTPNARGRVLGPVNLNLLSGESQTRLANVLAKRVNGMSADTWHAMVVQACAMVSAQWRAPTPTLDLSLVEDAGEIEYLIPGLVPANETTVLYGDGESAKSLMALYIATCVRLGLPLPWRVTPMLGRVLYLDWETNPKTVAGRLKRIAAGMNVPAPSIDYRQCVRSMVDELPSIREEISRKQIALVVVDSIGFAISGALVEDETARAAMNALRNMGDCTRLVVAHVSRTDANETQRKVKPFGSAFFWNGMRSGIEVRRAEEQDNQDVMDVGLFHRKANDGLHHQPVALSVSFDGRSGPITFKEGDVSEVPDLAARTSISSRLRAALMRGERDTKSLAEELEENEKSVLKTLKRMSDVQRGQSGGGRGNSATWQLRGTPW